MHSGEGGTWKTSATTPTPLCPLLPKNSKLDRKPSKRTLKQLDADAEVELSTAVLCPSSLPQLPSSGHRCTPYVRCSLFFSG